jgi:hypothetical protein
MASCDFIEDVFDDDDEYSQNGAWIGYGLVDKEEGSETFTIELDNGAVLYPYSHSGWDSQVSDNQRVLVNFTIVEDKVNTDEAEQYYVNINSLRNVLYKGIFDITPATEDSIGNDPIHVRKQWVKDNMLNFELSYRGGTTTHFINLVRQPDTTATEPVLLELRHNANDDPQMYRLSAVVTFDLSSLQKAGQDSVTYRVVAKDYDGSDYGYTGVYNY